MDLNPYQKQIDQLRGQLEQAGQLLSDPEMAQIAQVEIDTLNTQLQQLHQAAETFASAADDHEAEHQDQIGQRCTLELRAGAGGDEAKIWSDDLKRMYLRFAEQQNLKVSIVDDHVIQLKGDLWLTVPEGEISDDSSTQDKTEQEKVKVSVYELLKNESGVHRVQRVPVTEAQGRIHTSTATVAVLPEVPKTAVEIREEDLEWQFIRSSGAGGQSVNKTSSAVRLTHLPSGIAVSARSERKQTQNREIALQLLRSQLWEIEEEKRLSQIGAARSAIGRARRAEKIRTYNFPQNRVTDHRTKQSWHNLSSILDGYLIEPLTELYFELRILEQSSK